MEKNPSTITPSIIQFANIAESLLDVNRLIDLIKQVIEAPHIYAFSELLETSNVNKVSYYFVYFKILID